MLNKLTAFILTAAIFGGAIANPVLGQASQTKQAKQAEKVAEVRGRIAKLGTGEKAKVKVKLYSGTIYQGYVSSAGDSDFLIVDKTGASTKVNYSDVKSFVGKGLPLAAKIGIGVLAGIGALVVIFGIAYASSDPPRF